VSPKRFRDRYTDAVWAPNALRPNEILVALAYIKYAGAKDPGCGERAPENIAWVEWTTLSNMTGIRSRTGLSRAIKGLVHAGWMTQIEPARQHRAPRYELTIPPDPGVRFRYLSEDVTA
jgi:hypothetical protein